MSEWQIEPLGALADIRVSNVDKKSASGELPVRLCNYMDVYAGRYLGNGDRYMEAACTTRELAAFGLRRGDVLITKDSESPDDIAIPALIDDDVQELVCGYHLAVLRLRSDAIDPMVLLKQLESERLRRYFGQRAGGSTRYGLSTRAIAQAPILVPPEEVQRTIAETHRSLDRQIAHTEAMITKQEQVRGGLMQDLFTRGVDETGRLRPSREEAPELYQDTKLGWLPRQWLVSSLADLASAEITYGIVQAGSHVPDGVPYIRTGDMFGRHLSIDGLMRTSARIAAQYDRSQVRAGEVVIAIRAAVGKALQVPDELDGANLTQGTARFSPNSRLRSDFALWLLKSSYVQAGIAMATKGTTFSEITLSDLRKVPVAFPTEQGEQAKIASALNRLERHLDELLHCRLKLLHLRTALLRDLLAPPATAAAESRIAAE